MTSTTSTKRTGDGSFVPCVPVEGMAPQKCSRKTGPKAS